jgi:DNA-binding MarR family transcriptional regulator
MARRPVSTAMLLRAAERRLDARLRAGLRTSGYPGLGDLHLQLFLSIRPEGSGLSELAGSARVTRPAVGQLVRHLVRRGYLLVEPDPEDPDSSVIRLTEAGRGVYQLGLALTDEIEQRLAERLGERGLRELRRQLERLAS